MTEDFVNSANASFLQGMTEEQWRDFLTRWITDQPPNPTRFSDGTYYCDAGQEVERRVFWWFHKADNTICEHDNGERLDN